MLDANNDYSFGNGLLNFWIDVPNAPGQAVQTGLMLWLGEWYLDTSQGTPYIQGLLGKHSQAQADATIQNQVVNTQGITDISSYASQFNAQQRTYSAQISVDTIYGPTSVDIVNQQLY
jgi:hypothetical protein